jgi:ELWxxDGT repeat protein
LPFVTTMEGVIQTWATGGSAAGTVPIATPDVGLDFAFLPFEVPAVGGVLLGVGRDREHSIELWRSDLTADGTRLLADLNATDRGGSYPSDLRMVGETAYIFADDGASGFELWKSDGTAPGTFRVVDAVPGPEPVLRPAGNRILGADSQGRLYFVALTLAPDRYAVWRSDGTPAGTFPLTEPSPLVCEGGFAELGSRSYFPAGGGGHGCELWSSDGTPAGTGVLDAVPGLDGSNPAGLVRHGAALYFRGFESDHGGELWRSDGTEAGTARVADLEAGVGFGMRSDPVSFGGKVYFIGTDGTSPPALWSSDGTPAGTRIALPCSPSDGCRRMERFFRVGDRLWINQVNDPTGDMSLLASDGTPAGTARLAVATVYPGAPPTLFQGKVYFSALDRNFSGELWSSDGTAAGTRPLRGRQGALVGFPDSFQRLGDRLLFLASPEGSSRRFLWQTDGTQAGTSVVPGIAPTGDLGQPFSGASLAGTPSRLFLSAGDDEHGIELWGVTP